MAKTRPQLQPSDSSSFITFNDLFEKLLNVLQQFAYSKKLLSSTILDIMVKRTAGRNKTHIVCARLIWVAQIEVAQLD